MMRVEKTAEEKETEEERLREARLDVANIQSDLLQRLLRHI